MPLYALDGVSPILPQDAFTWVAPDAQLIGKVRLEVEASIWFGAVLRGDNEEIFVGARSNIQDGALLHTDMGHPLMIGTDCTIGHHATLHSCTIGENSLIGMGATLLTGAKIGRNCLIGAGALVTEGKEFPDNSLIIGMPAKLMRPLDEEEVESLRESAAHYVANARRFAKGLVALR
ncbi:MAG TPA: gamma carbonic anhydrase family protein [Methylocella sp.]|nr:gamma carbonic anhydrase family protein [Methylocella sp.]